jgi:hypothetical protein
VTTAILVEGSTDKKVFGILLERHGPHRPVTFRVKHRSDLLDGEKVAAFVRYGLLPMVTGLKKVLVCIDMECDPPEEVDRRVRAAQSSRALIELEVPVRFILVRFALESWLAADGAAWVRAFRFGVRSPLPRSILEECDPKRAIREHLKPMGFDFRFTLHDVRVAAELDIAEASRVSPSLAGFLGELS